MMRVSVFVLGFTLSVFSASAFAAPIHFIYQGHTRGTLDRVPFGQVAGVDFTIDAYGDTSAITDCGFGFPCLYVPITSASVELEGIGTLDVLNTAIVNFYNLDANVIGLINLDPFTDVINASPFDGWDLASSLGPITGLGSLFGAVLQTPAGDLVFNSSSTNITFQAIVAETIPEPATLLLLGTAAAFGARRLRRSR